MTKFELEDLDKIVFSNHENRNDILAVMRIAFHAGYDSLFNTKKEVDQMFDKWVKKVKRELDK